MHSVLCLCKSDVCTYEQTSVILFQSVTITYIGFLFFFNKVNSVKPKSNTCDVLCDKDRMQKHSSWTHQISQLECWICAYIIVVVCSHRRIVVQHTVRHHWWCSECFLVAVMGMCSFLFLFVCLFLKGNPLCILFCVYVNQMCVPMSRQV